MKNEISRILTMVENGKISAEQASSLIRAIKLIARKSNKRYRRRRTILQANSGAYMTHPDFMGINPLRACMEGMTYK